ncbi:hypothetical protein CNMCM6936_000798 [Aspergillus lentulus]|nr:hypothetical protein CNMCM6069_009751 [Aspergillus lentulus]KAF4168853.1 hypothetical protein CNMCM6936_000798 [Aspergillus lentulus]KAF4179621.1 hypothetical protein CNMCM8060_002761 [Aspergillus lentulus]KAF4197897.1 hypothetical protein CNMCM8694_001563 [Aspergillus lentulus]
MAHSESADLNASHSALRFLFKNPKKWTQKHLDSLRIQDHENPSVMEMVGETNVPTNYDPAYRLLTLQITLPSREHILSISDSDSWLETNAFTWVFDATHKLAQTTGANPDGGTPPDDLFAGIMSVMALLYRSTMRRPGIFGPRYADSLFTSRHVESGDS